MRYAVIDLETTGFSHSEDRVVEMACVLVQDGAIQDAWSSLVDPARGIPPYATRVHGITDEDVRGAPSFPIAQRRLGHKCQGATVVAHNAEFDLGFLPGLAHLPSLCTLRLARRRFPQAPNHRCQTLREYLRIDEDLRRLYPLKENLVAHRALGDALVTAAILLRCTA